MGIADKNTTQSTSVQQTDLDFNIVDSGLVEGLDQSTNINFNLSGSNIGSNVAYAKGGSKANLGSSLTNGLGLGGGVGSSPGGNGSPAISIETTDHGAIDRAFGFATEQGRESIGLAEAALDFSNDAISNANETFETAVSVLDNAVKTVQPGAASIEKILGAIVAIVFVGGIAYTYANKG